jgi:hypothetical protein
MKPENIFVEFNINNMLQNAQFLNKKQKVRLFLKNKIKNAFFVLKNCQSYKFKDTGNFSTNYYQKIANFKESQIITN